MRRYLIAALLAAGPSFAGDLVATEGKDSVRLTQEPCPVPVLKVLPEGVRGFFRKAVVLFEGKSWIACWAPRTDGTVHLVYSDGDSGLVPMDLFTEDRDGV
jgi:hypothetical protein